MWLDFAGKLARLHQQTCETFRKLAQRFGWGILAASLVILSAYLITMVTLVADEASRKTGFLALNVAIRTTDIITHEPRIFIEQNGQNKLIVQIIFPRKFNANPIILISNVESDTACDAINDDGDSIGLAVGHNFDGYVNLDIVKQSYITEVPVTDIKPRIKDNYDQSYTIRCSMGLNPFEKTFSDREIRIDQNLQSTFWHRNHTTHRQVGYNINLRSFARESGFRITGGLLDGTSIPDEERRLPGGSQARVFWKDERQSEYRDIFLIVIGSLLGLAATCVLEWIRPLLIRTNGDRS
jgi:hypothetical protein